MYPTLVGGEGMFTEKLTYTVSAPQRDDIIICRYPYHTEKCVKRVIAVPGDRISISDGAIYLNGQKLDESAYWDGYIEDSDMPEVTVPEFPTRPEDLAPCMVGIYETYFARAVVTAEDLEKTAQYRANADRKALAGQAASFEEYLKKLEICLIPEDAKENLDRLTQLFNKTNQFNLTTNRYTTEQMQQIVENVGKRVFLYRVTDIFGDNGIVVAAIVDITGELPQITDFVMSCRVMGRNIENAVIDRIEQQMQEEGFAGLRGKYLPTAKNKPVADLYEKLGYRETGTTPEGGKCYEILWQEKPERIYRLKETLYD